MMEAPDPKTPSWLWIESPVPLALFSCLMLIPIIGAMYAALLVDPYIPHPTLRILVDLGIFSVLFVALTLVVYRSYLRFFPFTEGEIIRGSANETRHQIYFLFWLFVFNPLLLPYVIPIPLRGSMLWALGASIGKRFVCCGHISDPHLVSIGNDVLLGLDSIIAPRHFIVGSLSHRRIRIGNGVTIGAHSIISPGVQIDDGAIIGFHSVVTQNTHIRANEVWAGSPARKIKNRETPK